MPPRRSARVAAAATARPSSALAPLPCALVRHIFSLLPVDERARAACVCPDWRHVLVDLSMWQRLDLSPSSGVTLAVTDALLAGAAGKARGQLQVLNISDRLDVSFDATMAVVRANAGALYELRVGVSKALATATLDAEHVARLLLAAPLLTACHADVFGVTHAADAGRMLRNEPPFGPLRLRAVALDFRGNADAEASVPALAAHLAAHASLERVLLREAPLHTLAALHSVVDAALAGQLVDLRFLRCRLLPAGAPALVRLLGGGTLTALAIEENEALLDLPAATLLGNALRANSTLTSFTFHVGLWHDMDVAAALLGALTGHRSLRTLNLAFNNMAAVAPAAGAALGALIAANAPALTALDVSSNHANEAALRPLFQALPLNTHLRALDVSFNHLPAALMHDVLPAVRANTSLRKLGTRSFGAAQDNAYTREAQALMAARGAAAAEAE
jgi:hypothetical protein